MNTKLSWIFATAAVVASMAATAAPAAIPKSCNNPKRLYLERSVKATLRAEGGGNYWILFAGRLDAKNPRYFAQHGVDTKPGGAWKVGGPNKDAPLNYLYMHVPSNLVGTSSTAGGSKGWLFGARQPAGKASGSDWALFFRNPTNNLIPDVQTDNKQMVLRKFKKGKAYPNIFAREVGGRNFVFFETANGKTIRPYVDEARQILSYDQC